MSNILLHKMNGLGNDFLIFTKQENPNITLSDTNIIELSNRNNSITGGCDQFITILESPKYDAFMKINNADGSEVDACGNATRCVIKLINDSPNLQGANFTDFHNINIETNAGILNGSLLEEGASIIQVEMTTPDFYWNNIPLSQEVTDILDLPISFQNISGSAVSMGNPHLVFLLDEDVNNLNLANIGAEYETHNLFPERTNVSFANIIDKNNIRLRVFERGVGETEACGTAACATHAIANKKGLISNQSNIHLNGGSLIINWNSNYPEQKLFMTGETEYERSITLSLPSN